MSNLDDILERVYQDRVLSDLPHEPISYAKQQIKNLILDTLIAAQRDAGLSELELITDFKNKVEEL